MADSITGTPARGSKATDDRPPARTSEHAVTDAATFASARSDGTPVNEGDGLYRLLVESVLDYAIFALDAEGHVMSWNPGAQRFKGYLPDEIIGKHFSIFYTEEEKYTKPAWELTVAEREGRVEDEGWRVRKDGTRFWANIVITALRAPDGKLVGFAKVTRDLSERRAAELQALAAARRVSQAEEANQVKASFLAAMSHELRTPLNAIGGYADLLLTGIGGAISPQQKQYLERIRGSQQHLLAIINDILNFSRIEAGRLTVDVGPVSLQDVVDTVVPMIEPQAVAKKIGVKQGDFAEAVVSGDKSKIEQILLNLLSNAVKFTPAGGSISIVCEKRGDCYELGVRDTGMGIPEAELDAIFQPFIQVGRSLTSKQEGTGLGLAISSDLAKAMGGELRVESKIDEGSTFTLSLPQAKAAVK
jgi:PAS domain S-box-containing protein